VTAQRFVIGIDLQEDNRDTFRQGARLHDLPMQIDQPRLLIAARLPSHALPVGRDGIVMGVLYARGSNLRISEIGPASAAGIASNSGKDLLEKYWGDYVAVIRTNDGFAVIRGPFGHLPCLYRAWGGGTVLASDIDSLRLATHANNSVAFKDVARQLIVGDMRTRDTCLTGIREVRGGEIAQVSGAAISHTQSWSPWKFASERGAVGPQECATAKLRDLAMTCVNAKTLQVEKPLVLLSGDSSIVTACLNRRRPEITCLNLIAPASAGDERTYARACADHLGLELLEMPMWEPSLNIGALAAVRLPRPVARSFEQGLFLQAQTAAENMGCDAVIDGGGGDNVFCSLQSASPAADCLLDRSGHRYFWRTCGEIAELAQSSLGHVAWKALCRAQSRKRPYRWPINKVFLSAGAIALADDAVLHPWLEMDDSRLPGRAAQIALLVGAQSFIEDGPHGSKMDVISPLVSQPLIEHCLSIPTWHWFDNGCNRAAARHAFSPLLPHNVVWRRGKGIPNSFIARLFEANRAAIREHLIEGRLASEGIIDVGSVLAALDDPAPFGGKAFSRLVRLMDTESWARSVTGC